MNEEERRARQAVLTDAAKQRLRASTHVAAMPALTWEEYEAIGVGLELLGELGMLRDSETPFQPLVYSLITAVRESQISIERALLIAPDLDAYRERRRGLRRRADRREDLEHAILGSEELDEFDRAALLALYKAMCQRPQQSAEASV